jgi:hypothetical protein
MKKIKEGDIVEVVDGSYSIEIIESGELVSTGANITQRRFEVVSTNCDLPAKWFHDTEKPIRNDTILRDIDNGQTVFIQNRFLQLKHRCNTCASCGQQL